MADQSTEAGRSTAGAAARLAEGVAGAVNGLGERLAAILEAERPRWFLWSPVFLGAGIACYFQLADEPPLVTALALPVLAAALRWLAAKRHLVRLALSLLFAFSSGFALAKVRTEWVRAPVLENRVGPVEVTGVVELVEPRAGRGQRITLRVTSLGKLAREEMPVRVRVRAMKALDGLEAGETVAMKAMLAPPSAPSLPGDYDFARAAWFSRLGAVGYSLSAPRRVEGAEGTGLLAKASAAIERVRQDIGSRVVATLPGERGAIANALITGERGAISEETNDAFRDSGLLHILSISGLHMAIMAGAVFLFVRVGLAAVPALALRYQTKKWAAGAAMVAGLGYLLISGFSVATVRSWFMTSIMLLAVMLDRPALTLRNVALAALLVLVATPESLNDVGFQMSFAAVIALISLHEFASPRVLDAPLDHDGALRRMFLFLAGITVSTLAASIAVAPFAAFHFHKSQQYAVLANLIAIPICNFLVMPAALLSFLSMPLGLERAPLVAMGWGIDAITGTADFVAGLPGAVGYIPAIPAPAFALIVTGGLWLALWRTRWRLIGLGLVALGVAASPFGERPDLLVGGRGELVALRNEQGALSLLAGRGSRFEGKRWLEHDGDARSIEDAMREAHLRCDGLGCTGQFAGAMLAISRHPAALRDDCRAARVLVLPVPRPLWCQGPALVIDVFDLMSKGAHAVYTGTRGEFRVETVNGWRGTRPWVQVWRPREPRRTPQSTRHPPRQM